MICPYCGTYNHDNAVYCEGCGRYIEKKSSSSFISNNQFLIIISGLILLVILGVSAGALLGNGPTYNNTANTSNTTNSSNITTTQSYSDGKISFNYPNDFFNITNVGNGTNWINLKSYENSEGTEIDVGKSDGADDPTYVRQSNDDSLDSGKVISHTTETNPNGITVYKDIYTGKYDGSNDTFKAIDLYFNDKKGVVYCVSVYDTESNYQTVSDTANMIFNSLKLS